MHRYCPFPRLVSCGLVRLLLYWEKEGHSDCPTSQPIGNNSWRFAFVKKDSRAPWVRFGRAGPNWWTLDCCLSLLLFRSKFWPFLCLCRCGILSSSSLPIWSEKVNGLISQICGCSNRPLIDFSTRRCLSLGKFPWDTVLRRCLAMPVRSVSKINVFSHRFSLILSLSYWACTW